MNTRIRLLKMEDSSDIWKIRNHPIIRTQSTNSAEISKISHNHWFNKYFETKNKIVYILEDELLNFIGYCRYDLQKSYYRVSIAIHPDFHHQGYGYILLSETINKLKQFEIPIHAKIKLNNTASQNLFMKANFKRSDQNKDKNRELLYIYTF